MEGKRPTIAEAQEAIVADFGMLDDWLDRYQQLIDMGQALPQAPEVLHREENLIKGCQSRVWIDCQKRDGLLYFQADSDAVITKGIAALLVEILSGHTPREIAEAELFAIDRIGLKENLSPNRANGLTSMVERIRAYARENLTEGEA